MRWMVLALVLGACGAKAPVETPKEQPAAEAPAEKPSDDAPAEKPAPSEPPMAPEGLLNIPSTVTAGEEFMVGFVSMGSNGCYQQTEVETTIEGQEITHAYTFSYVGEICTMALVDGGFKTYVVVPEAGQYTGKIMVNGEEKGRYTVEAK